VVEATAGNTGLGLALVARIKGYRVVLVVPDKMAAEKVLHLKALGAEIHLTRSDVGKGHPEYYQDYAARLAREIPGAWFADQFNNPANPLAHETTTGPEIWEQMRHEVDAIVVGVGSSGTLTGLSRYFARVQPDVEFVLADPKGSILADYVAPATCPRSRARGRSKASARTSSRPSPTCRACAAPTPSATRKASTPRAPCCARKASWPAPRPAPCWPPPCATAASRPRPKRVVTFVCDTGTRYLTKVYSDGWMVDQGLLQRPRTGDLRDLIGAASTTAKSSPWRRPTPC
jgi:cystathionine beta-synthase